MVVYLIQKEGKERKEVKQMMFTDLVGMTVEEATVALMEMVEDFDLFEEEDGEVLSIMVEDADLFVEDGVVVSLVTNEEM